MLLKDIIELKVGERFQYKGQLSTVMWTQYLTEEVGSYKDKKTEKEVKLYAKYFGMAFELDSGMVNTIRSMHPDPKVLELPEFRPAKLGKITSDIKEFEKSLNNPAARIYGH